MSRRSKPRFGHLEVGDQVVRLVGGFRHNMYVEAIKGDLVYCNITPKVEGPAWMFDRATGIEIDSALNWGIEQGVTGSYLLDADETPPEGVRILGRGEIVLAKMAHIRAGEVN